MERNLDAPIHRLLEERWSPYAFADQPVSREDVRSLFEAARWAPSAYNAQPWFYLTATRENPEEFQRLLSCLIDANQAWAQAAPVLALGAVRLDFEHNGKPNRTALHDLGLASACLVMEATARGLHVHQMSGLDPDRAREVYSIPEGFEVWTALAVGVLGDPESLPEDIRPRDLNPRPRKPLSEFVFSGEWGSSASL